MMTYDELVEHNKNRGICQIGILTKDLKKAMDAWIEYLKVGPWKVCEISDENTKNKTMNGSPNPNKFKMKVALASMGNIQIELIEPCYGLPLYEEHMKKYGESIHHFKERFSSEEFDQAVADYARSGLGNIFSGDFYEARFVYLNTAPVLNFNLELGNFAVTNLPEGTWYMYPART